MTLSEYNEWAKTKRRKGTKEADWRNAALGFAGEFGEICDLIKKDEFHLHGLDYDKLKLELGDLLFYFVWLWDLATEGRHVLVVMESEQDPFFMMADFSAGIFNNDFWVNDSCRVLGAIEDLAGDYGFRLEDLMQANMDKLNARYPNGFSEAASQNRVA